MMKKMIDYVTFNDRRFCTLWSVVLIIGLILMRSTIMTGDLDEIDLSDSYEMVLFIIFMLGIFLSLTGIQVIIHVCMTKSLRGH